MVATCSGLSLVKSPRFIRKQRQALEEIATAQGSTSHSMMVRILTPKD